MERKNINLAGMAFIVYSLLVAARGIINLVINMKYGLTIQQMLSSSILSIIFPIIMLTLGVFTLLLGKNKKMILVFLSMYAIYYVFCVIESICRAVIFSDMVDELNMHLGWLVIYELNTVIQCVLYFIAMLIVIVGVKKIIIRKVTNKLHIISCILMTIAVLMQAIEYVSHIFVAYYNIGFVTAVVALGISAIFIVAIYLLGMQLNVEIKSDSILQE